MFRPRIIPVLLLLNKGLVKTIRFKNPTYVGDPMNAVKIFNDLKADELVFLDITATKENRTPPLDLLRKIAEEAYMPFAAGGGVKTLDHARGIINAGAEKVVINTGAVETPDLIEQAAAHFGNQSVVVSIDAKKNAAGAYEVFTHSGGKATALHPAEVARQSEALGAGEIMINSIDRDGTFEGYDVELVKQVADAVRIPVIACGGAKSYENLAEPYRAGATAVAAGSLFVFVGRKRAVLINYPEKEEMEEVFGKAVSS
jgi:cyclase